MENNQGASNNPAGSGASLRVETGKYLTFKLASEDYGIGVLKVQEIIGMMKVTRVPQMPEFVRGIVNLRGKLVPVIEMRSKFKMASQEDSDRTCIIVVQVCDNNTSTTMGIIVDSVSEVLDIRENQLDPAPSFGAKIDTAFILGIGKVSDKVVMLLDIDSILSGVDVMNIDQNSIVTAEVA